MIEKSQRALDLDLAYIKSIYTRLIVTKALKGDDVSLLVERLKAVEIQIWGMKTAKNIIGRKNQSNG